MVSAKQRKCLAWYARVEGPGTLWAAGTLSSLRKRGLIERFKGFGPGGSTRTHYRITEEGRATLELLEAAA